jgi:tetratricopeptide (TPR) repeat protein
MSSFNPIASRWLKVEAGRAAAMRLGQSKEHERTPQRIAMSTPHNFSDDPNAFPGPQPPASNTKTILIVIASVLGVVVLMCGGLITAGVFLARKASQELEQFAEEMQAEMEAGQQSMGEFQSAASSGDYKTALEVVDQQLASSPNDANSHNNKAWLLATCPSEEFRDGEAAVEHATKACELTGWAFAGFIDTLAAAHAEAGDFEAAAEWQQKAIDADTTGVYRDEFRERLVLFQSGKPYREDPQPGMNFDMQDFPVEPDGLFPPADAGVDAVESVFDDASESKALQE